MNKIGERLNERGVTLIEMLAALALMTVIVAVGSMLMAQISSLTENATIRANDDGDARHAVKMIRAELSQATELYVASASEVRYRKNFDYYALRYDSALRTLTRYSFNSAKPSKDLTQSEIAEAQAKFIERDASSDSTLYLDALRISDQITALAFIDAATQATPLATPAHIQSGNFKLIVDFVDRRARTGGGAKIVKNGSDRYQWKIVVNLLDDTV